MRNKACEECGIDDIRVLEFDHTDPKQKEFSISQSVSLNHNWDKVLTEISKCRILCANCHKIEQLFSKNGTKHRFWRRVADLNCCKSFCRASPNHSANAPYLISNRDILPENRS